jgi:hypothetical protein
MPRGMPKRKCSEGPVRSLGAIRGPARVSASGVCSRPERLPAPARGLSDLPQIAFLAGLQRGRLNGTAPQRPLAAPRTSFHCYSLVTLNCYPLVTLNRWGSGRLRTGCDRSHGKGVCPNCGSRGKRHQYSSPSGLAGMPVRNDAVAVGYLFMVWKCPQEGGRKEGNHEQVDDYSHQRRPYRPGDPSDGCRAAAPHARIALAWASGETPRSRVLDCRTAPSTLSCDDPVIVTTSL